MGKPIIEYADFDKLDLRVGTVVRAEAHPDADKLLKLSIDLGEETPRQIIAGLAKDFAPEALEGRQVIVVANLAPRMLRGLESQGMVLAARDDAGLKLILPQTSTTPGSSVS